MIPIGPQMPASNDPPPGKLPPDIVVVPLDGSTYAASVLPYAQRLARRFGARVQTVTVGELSEPGAEVQLQLDGDPAEALLAHLVGLDRALVCMASHGHGGLRRRLLGSVAEALVRQCVHPVIIHGPEAEIGGPPHTIVAGLAWSPRREQMLATLSAWALPARRPPRTRPRPLAQRRGTLRGSHDRARATRRAQPQPDRGEAQPTRRSHLHPPARRRRPGDVTAPFARKQPAPVLLVVDSHQADEPAHRDIAYRLIRRSPWPVLATVGI